MKDYFCALVVFFFISGCCYADTVANLDTNLSSFHRAKSDAEKALDHLLESDKTVFTDKGTSEVSPGLHDYIIGYRGRDRSYDTLYDGFFTSKLRDAWRKKEKTLVQLNCHGHYIKGELCGLDYDPLTCAQDDDDSYLYRTDRDDGKQALITYMWPSNGQQEPYVRVITCPAARDLA